MGNPRMVDVQAALMEPLEIREAREWRKQLRRVILASIGLGFALGLLAAAPLLVRL